MSKHPIQPVYLDPQGVIRCKPNAIVRRLVDLGLANLNVIATWDDISGDDHAQFAQLLGWSVSGLGDLERVDAETLAALDEAAAALLEAQP